MDDNFDEDGLPVDPYWEGLGSGYRLRIGVLTAIVVGVWLGVALDPTIGPIGLFVLTSLGATVLLALGAMGLGLLGFGLFALGDWAIRWARRASSWPEE